MAFAAIHPRAGRIDATRHDLGAGLAWEQVHKTRPRVALTCPDCGHGVHAKVSARRLRYFAHNPGRPAECVWDNESLEHHLLKLELATAIRDLGWHAELEVRAPDGSWRADVLASTHDGARRMAWEAQLSPITEEDIAERTDRYLDDGIQACWVGVVNRLSWMDLVPSLQVQAPDGDGPWTVVDGVAGFDYREGSWRVTKASLPEVLGWVLREQVLFHEVLSRYQRILLGSGRGKARREAIWTSPRSVEAEGRHEQMRQRQEAWKRAQAERKRQQELLHAHEQALPEDARRAEAKRLAAIRAAEEAARFAEWQRQSILEDEQRRLRREAEEAARREEEERVEVERQQQEQVEYTAACTWWQQISAAQREELQAAVAEPVWRRGGGRLSFDDRARPEHAYGIAVHRTVVARYGSLQELQGILRPSPASLHRLPEGVSVFVRNAREARQLADLGVSPLERIIHFDLPDGEQLSLL